MDVAAALDVWRQLIRPQLEYGLEVWADGAWSAAEQLQIRVGRRILGCKKSTAAAAIRGELGWWRAHVRCDYLRLQYWHRLVYMDEDRLTKQLYRATRAAVMVSGNDNFWCSDIFQILQRLGLEAYWLSEELPSRSEWAKLTRRRLQESEEKLWLLEINQLPKLRTYRLLKYKLACERYLYVLPREQRMTITQLRVGVNQLRIESGRWKREPVECRICRMCYLDIEDERHFLMNCPAYSAERLRMMADIVQVTGGRLRLKELLSDDARLRVLIGCGCMDECFVSVYKIVARFVARCFTYRTEFLLSASVR